MQPCRMSIFFLLTAISIFCSAQPIDPSRVEVSLQPVEGNLYMVKGRGGNIGVFTGPDGVFLIDSQFAPLTDKILAAIRTVSDQPIRYLVNTHFHFDHIGGNENFARRETLIFAHDNVRKRMQGGIMNLIRNLPLQSYPPAALPVVTFNDRLSFHINGESVEVIYLPPAHTDGDAIVYFPESDVIHTGDVFRTVYYPIVDINYGGKLDGIIHAHEVMLELAGPDTKIIPGHGKLTGRSMLEQSRDMIVTVRNRIKRMYDAGKSLEEILAAQPTAEFDHAWDSPDAALGKKGFIERYYRELNGDFERL